MWLNNAIDIFLFIVFGRVSRPHKWLEIEIACKRCLYR